jgi:hypothetical protein
MCDAGPLTSDTRKPLDLASTDMLTKFAISSVWLRRCTRPDAPPLLACSLLAPRTDGNCYRTWTVISTDRFRGSTKPDLSWITPVETKCNHCEMRPKKVIRTEARGALVLATHSCTAEEIGPTQHMHPRAWAGPNKQA